MLRFVAIPIKDICILFLQRNFQWTSYSWQILPGPDNRREPPWTTFHFITHVRTLSRKITAWLSIGAVYSTTSSVLVWKSPWSLFVSVYRQAFTMMSPQCQGWTAPAVAVMVPRLPACRMHKPPIVFVFFPRFFIFYSNFPPFSLSPSSFPRNVLEIPRAIFSSTAAPSWGWQIDNRETRVSMCEPCRCSPDMGSWNLHNTAPPCKELEKVGSCLTKKTLFVLALKSFRVGFFPGENLNSSLWE